MVTLRNFKDSYYSGRSYELYGLSTDVKPTVFKNVKITNTSTFYEMDTRSIYIFDEENQVWLEDSIERASAEE